MESQTVGFTVRIPEGTYNTLLAYKERFKPHLSLNALIVEAIIEEIARKMPSEALQMAEAQP
jgi:hypothetical protein